jgi:two-component system, NtrC family, nitrogen regulation response regulator NtrX
LDEIGDMSLPAQAKVLRALQEHKITRVGGEKEISVDVRVVAATNKDLLKEVEARNFREDLYHRLGVILIQVPSLNDRREDIPALIEKFLGDLAADYGSKPKRITKGALEYLKALDWRGNIRELRNVTERLVIMGGDEISEDDARSFARK